MYSLLVNFILIVPIMAGYPSNLAKKFSTTEQFPQHILHVPLLPIYNAQLSGYESLTSIVLVLPVFLDYLNLMMQKIQYFIDYFVW